MRTTLALLLATSCLGDIQLGGDRGARITEGDHQDPVPPEGGFLVELSGIGKLGVIPDEIVSVRSELFEPGWFSLFDVLVHLDARGDIDLAYHFDPALDTHVIDSLNGTPHWWYDAWYDRGWSESSVHRMDYFPVKDPTHITFSPTTAVEMERRYAIWRAEVQRRQQNGGGVVIPIVTIRARSSTVDFFDVEVTAWDLRRDVFRVGTPTAIDILLSMSEQGLLDVDIEWIEHMGQALVQSFFVDAIGDQRHSGGCGFVYEVGEQNARAGNHVHLMSDIRVLHNPEYALFFWIELGSC